MQAILALMVGAFTFGCYITFQEATDYTEKNQLAEQIKIHAEAIKENRERIIRLEIQAE